jgi:hypothetical protein
MATFEDHEHLSPITFAASAATQGYAEIVGTVEPGTTKPIVGRNGQHLQFEVDVKPGIRYQVDVNVQSRDGSEVEVFTGDEQLVVQSGGTPFGDPQYGVYKNAKLSYNKIGLTENQFVAMPDTRIEALLETALSQAVFVAVYGSAFDDGGANGKGIHDIHLNPGHPDQDGAITVYLKGTSGSTPTRRWFFFKFRNDRI